MSYRTRLQAAISISLREQGRNIALLSLVVALPFLFITVSFAVTPSAPVPVYTFVDGAGTTIVETMPAVHGVIMTPITGAFITGLTGLFVMQSAAAADGRLIQTGYRPREVILARFGTLLVTATLVTTVATAVMLQDFRPQILSWFLLGVLLVSAIYGFIGMLVGIVFDRTAGMYVLLFGPLMDIGVFQDPMFVRGPAAWWMQLFPGHYPVKMMLDAAFTPEIDTIGASFLGLGYLLIVVMVTILLFRRQTGGS